MTCSMIIYIDLQTESIVLSVLTLDLILPVASLYVIFLGHVTGQCGLTIPSGQIKMATNFSALHTQPLRTPVFLLNHEFSCFLPCNIRSATFPHSLRSDISLKTTKLKSLQLII